MRTDLITAWIIKEWLSQHLPHWADSWSLEVDDAVRQAAEHLKLIVDDVPRQVISQNALARLIIHRWNLDAVALIGGGAPTPLSVKPEEVMYYTDASADVVQSALEKGYRALRVDVTKAEDIALLMGAKAAIATGLMHFLPDSGMQAVLHNLANAGFETLIFNHGNRRAGTAVIEQYAKMGIGMYLRDRGEVEALLPEGWRIVDLYTGPEFIEQHGGELSQYLVGMPPMIDLYRVVRN